jgi:beta-1,4-mannosyl-glycoprotein beta-1,4-N-acetylglucosaminyltransferase
MQIIDTFIFNNDFKTLEIRLNELSAIVDKFIISESNYSHSGIQKPLHLLNNLDKFAEFQDKIILVSNTKKIITRNARIREQFQRNLINPEITKLKLNDSDVIIHSDCDEIPRASTILNITKKQLDSNYLLELDDFSHFINLYQGKWARCTVTPMKFFKGVQFARKNIFMSMAHSQQRINTPLIRVPDFWTTRRFFRFFPEFKYDPKLRLVKSGGWHFNNLFSDKDLVTKILFSSHTELVNKIDLNLNNIRHLKNNKLNVYTKQPLKIVPLDKSYPKYILNNLEKFMEFIVFN